MNHLTFSPLERVLAFLAGIVNLIVGLGFFFLAYKYPCYFRSFHWRHYYRQRCWGFLALYRKGMGACASACSCGAGLWNTCSSRFAVSFVLVERLVSFLDLLFV